MAPGPQASSRQRLFPPWIEKRKEIEARLENAVLALSRAWSSRRASLQAGEPQALFAAEWKRAEEAFRSESAEINKLIFSYNLEVPTQQVQRLWINVEREIQKVTGANTAWPI